LNKHPESEFSSQAQERIEQLSDPLFKKSKVLLLELWGDLRDLPREDYRAVTVTLRILKSSVKSISIRLGAIYVDENVQ
jgi:hypothetical protein